MTSQEPGERMHDALSVAILVVREKIDHPWQGHAWRAVAAVTPPPPVEGWTLLERTETATRYLVGPATIELNRHEAGGYLENLENDEPLLYVVLRPTDDAERPLLLQLVTASPTEAQAYGLDGEEIIDTVPMPPETAAMVLDFATRHHDPKPFVKRVRTSHARPEVHLFGQEPIFDLRRRMGSANGKGGSDGPEQ